MRRTGRDVNGAGADADDGIGARARRLQRSIVARHRGTMVLATLLLCVYQIAEASVALLLGWIADHVLASGDARRLAVGVAVLGLTIAAVSASWQCAFRLLQRRNAGQVHLLRREMTRSVVAEMDPVGRGRRDNRAGPAEPFTARELPTVVGEDTVQASDIIEVVPVAVSSLVGVAFCSAALAMIDVPLGALVVVSSVMLLLILQVLSRAVERRGTRQQELLATVAARLTDVLRGLPTIAGVAGGRPIYDGYATLSARARRQARRAAWVNGGYESVAAGGSVFLVAAVGLAAGYRAMQGAITVGDLVAVVALSQFIAEPMRTLSGVPRYAGLSRASARRVVRVPAAGPVLAGVQVPTRGAGDVPALAVGEMECADGVLTAVECAPATAEAIVTALVDGDQPATAAAILVRGVPVDIADIRSLRGVVMAEPRHPALFGETIAEALACEDRRRAVDVVCALGLDELAPSAAAVLDLRLDDGGVNLSGGQRQRLALGRALCAEPEILVVVDPTSAVDAMTAVNMADAIYRWRAGRTTVILRAGRALESIADAHVGEDS